MTSDGAFTGGVYGQPFDLPVGYTDALGTQHRSGQMRLATAADEIEPLGDPRVKENEAFFGMLLLSRVVVRLGDFSPVPLEVIAGLYVSDFAFLQALYIELNSSASTTSPPFRLTTLPTLASSAFQKPPTLQGSIETSCPQCGAELILDLDAASDLAPA